MSSDPPTTVTVYWRPGCGFCSRLRSRLSRLGVTTTEVNIWEDPSAAAFVRSVAGGNETVPTVTVGGRSFVNPSAETVLDAARELAPSAVGAPIGGIGRWFRR